jgi:hypothetical protein
MIDPKNWKEFFSNEHFDTLGEPETAEDQMKDLLFDSEVIEEPKDER